MSKELTEQWRNGTLPKGWYYVEISSEEIKKLYCGDGETLELDDPETSAYYFYYKKHDESKIDILGVVPGYMDCKGLMYDSIALDKARKRIDELETKCNQLEKLQDFCELLLVGEKQEWEKIVKRGNRKEIAEWLNENKNKTIERLKKQLEMATTALKNAHEFPQTMSLKEYCEQALKDIEEVK